MKCKGCNWQSSGYDFFKKEIKYCIASPETDPKESNIHLLDRNRIIFMQTTPAYRADDTDDCHCWHSERFKALNSEADYE
jgi:hypothetical protein